MKHSSKKKKGEFRKRKPPYPRELPQGVRAELIALGEEIHSLVERDRSEEAIKLCLNGLERIPKPQDAYIETIWYLSALGDIYFTKGIYCKAYEYYDRARRNLSGEGEKDPFIMLRLGEIAFETGNEEAALRYLLGAYKAEGEEIFEDHGSIQVHATKYYDFLRSHADLSRE